MTTPYDHPDDLADMRETMYANSEAVHLPYAELPETGHVIPLPEIIVDPTYQNVKWILEHKQYRYFAWTSDDKHDQPLCIDMQTANVVCTVHDACSQHAQEVMEKHIHTSRVLFAKTVNVCWSCVK